MDVMTEADLETLPEAYQNGSIQFEVPADGTDQANFDIESR